MQPFVLSSVYYYYYCITNRFIVPLQDSKQAENTSLSPHKLTVNVLANS